VAARETMPMGVDQVVYSKADSEGKEKSLGRLGKKKGRAKIGKLMFPRSLQGGSVGHGKSSSSAKGIQLHGEGA